MDPLADELEGPFHPEKWGAAVKHVNYKHEPNSDISGDHHAFEHRDSDIFDYEYIVFMRFDPNTTLDDPRLHQPADPDYETLVYGDHDTMQYTFICTCPDEESVWEMFWNKWAEDHPEHPVHDYPYVFVLTEHLLDDDHNWTPGNQGW